MPCDTPEMSVSWGLDLAWSDRNPSGVAHLVLQGNGCLLLETDHLSSDEDITTPGHIPEIGSGVSGPFDYPANWRRRDFPQILFLP